MKNRYWAGLALLGLLTLSGQAHADLVVSGMGTIAGIDGNYKLIHDTDLDITWLDYTSPEDLNRWDNHMTWAANLVVTVNGVTYDNWRLPSTVDDSETLFEQIQITYDGSASFGYNNPDTSELSHLFYTELGNNGYFTTDAKLELDPYGLNNTGPFDNLVSATYWSSTLDQFHYNEAWVFNMDLGLQGVADYYLSNPRGLAIFTGHIQTQPLPEPASLLVFGIGLAGFIGLKRRKN
ncbi:PEP-CTERM sorting domain-containing protein [Desulfosediminicola flagellatus]|uniref:PEP-CTERM sorting domain-containing protein n=1 Tax=Desulfosediminicola flagellatus TaxID=2569541 RepID=UPI0010AB5C9B|nr:PEP-CTERM sorting domain-containing protein [Desulfosediminicola flagellatus]